MSLGSMLILGRSSSIAVRLQGPYFIHGSGYFSAPKQRVQKNEQALSTMKPTLTLPEKIKKTIEVDIDPKEWVYVPQIGTFVKIGQVYNGLTQTEALIRVRKETPFVVTSLPTFVNHYTNVCNAINSNRKKRITLYDGANEPLSSHVRDDLYEQLTTGSWLHLDALFEEERGPLGTLMLLTDHDIGQQGLQPRTRQPLEQHEQGKDNMLVNLQWNAQGLPTRKSQLQEYKKGKNIYFLRPEANSAARFCANLGGVILGCNGGLYGSHLALGVLLSYTPKK